MHNQWLFTSKPALDDLYDLIHIGSLRVGNHWPEGTQEPGGQFQRQRKAQEDVSRVLARLLVYIDINPARRPAAGA